MELRPTHAHSGNLMGMQKMRPTEAGPKGVQIARRSVACRRRPQESHRGHANQIIHISSCPKSKSECERAKCWRVPCGSRAGEKQEDEQTPHGHDPSPQSAVNDKTADGTTALLAVVDSAGPRVRDDMVRLGRERVSGGWNRGCLLLEVRGGCVLTSG